jgi:hypothetical protein
MVGTGVPKEFLRVHGNYDPPKGYGYCDLYQGESLRMKELLSLVSNQM